MTVTTAATEQIHVARLDATQPIRARHAASSETTPSRAAAVRSTLAGVAADVGLPVGTYYALHALGASDTVALLAGTVAAGARVAVVAIRTRRVTAFAVLLLAVYAFGLAMTFVNGDPHFLLVKESFGTAVVGLGFLASLLTNRPMILESMKSIPSKRNEDLVARYATEPSVRRTVRLLTAVWGVGLLVDALVRIPVVYALPISVGVAVSHVMMVPVIALLVVITGLIVKRARRAATAH